MFITKRKNFWYVHWTDEAGRRRKKSTGCKSKSEALKFLSSFDPSGPPEPEKPSVDIPLSDFMDEYISYESKIHTLKSVKGSRTAFSEFIRISGNIPIGSVDIRTVENFLAFKRGEASDWTCSKYYATLAAAFQTAVRWGILQKNVFRSVKRPRIAEKRPAFFNREQFDILLSVVDSKDFRELILFGVSTGCRQREIITLRWKDVDTKRRVIDVVNYGNFQTKSKKSRTIPISKQLCRMLDLRTGRYRSDLVFPYQGREWIPESISKKFKRYIRKAGLPEELKFHSLRHTFASWLIQSGVSLYEVSRLLGHSTIRMSEKYAHLQIENLHSTVDKIAVNYSDIGRDK